MLTFSLLIGWVAFQAGKQGWAAYHYERAQRALEARKYDSASKHIQSCLKVWPDKAAAQLLAARVARRAGLLEEADQHLRNCDRLPRVREDTTLERILLEVERGEFARMEEYLRTCIHQDHPETLEILDVYTWELMRSHRLAEARYYLDRWLERRPVDEEAWLRRGWVDEFLMNHDSAMSAYRKVLEINPRRGEVRLRLAQILAVQKKAEEAIDHLERLLKQDGNNPWVLLTLAGCRHQLGQFREAREALEKVIHIDPKNADAFAELGRIALEEGDSSEAEEKLGQAAALDPNNRQVNYDLSLCLRRLGKKQEAETCAARLRQVDADFESIVTLVREIPKKPHDASLRYEIGMKYLRNGYVQDGLRWLDTALKEDPQHADTLKALADHWQHHGQAELAARYRRLARLAQDEVRRN